MTIYHRNLGHNWNVARRETNYALFGNERGDVASRPIQSWNGHTMTDTERRASWWWAMHCVETVRVRRNLCGADKRKESLTWLRYKELEA